LKSLAFHYRNGGIKRIAEGSMNIMNISSASFAFILEERTPYTLSANASVRRPSEMNSPVTGVEDGSIAQQLVLSKGSSVPLAAAERPAELGLLLADSLLRLIGSSPALE